MGFVANTANRIREFFRQDKEALALRMAKGTTSAGYPGSGYDLLQAYGYDVLSDYMKLEHDLLSRFVDYEEMDDYPELSTALDIHADDATQPETQLNRSVWVESKDESVQQLLDTLLHKTLRLDEEIWEIARTTCIKEGSRVWTAVGPKPIETIEPGEWVQSRNPTTGQSKLVKIVRRFDNGVREVWRVRTKHRELFVTPDHKLLVANADGSTSWTKVADLKLHRWPGGTLDPDKTSKLVISTGVPEVVECPSWAALGVTPSILGASNKGTPTELKLPERIEPWFCRLLGFLWGDGFMGSADLDSTSTAVCFSRGVYEELNEYYDDLLHRLGLTTELNEARQRTETHSIRFKELLTELGWKNGASNKRLPLWLGKTPKAHRKAFLDGFMDADGWESQQKTWTRVAKHFEIANVELAYDLKALVDGMGYRSGQIRVRTRKPGFKIKGVVVQTTQPAATLTFSDFDYEPGFKAEGVVELSKQGDFRVYDLEVDDDAHCFVTEGVLTHNCKYGNDFEEILVTEKGVEGLNYLPAPTVRRIEGPRGELFGFVQDFKGKFGYTPQEFQQILAARAASKMGGDSKVGTGGLDRIAALEDWEVAHFRLRGKQRRSIYGHSVMESSRWIWKRLMLLEDAALIYRLQRAPERFAFYVDVGDLPPAEALAFVNRVRQQHKKTKYFNPTSGKLDLKFNPISQDEDYFVPSRKGQDGTRIEKLGAPSWQHMEDIEYFRDKLFAALKVPKAYMGQEQGVARAVLSSEDVRFARTVLRVQREIRNGLSKVCRVHMMALNIDPYATDYDIRMTVPSSIFELAQLEVRNARADLAQRMQSFVPLSFLMSNVFGFNDYDIEKIIKGQEEDAIRQAVVQVKAEIAAQKYQQEHAPQPPPDAMPPGGDPNAVAAPGQPVDPNAPPQAGAPVPGAPAAPSPTPPPVVPTPQAAQLVQRYNPVRFGKSLNEKKRSKGGLGISEAELFEGAGSARKDKENYHKLEKLLHNDRTLAIRLLEVRSLVEDIRNSQRR